MSSVDQGYNNQSYQFGYEVIGPVIVGYLLKLDMLINKFDARGAKILFMSRAGIRILRLYEIYLNVQGRKLSPNVEIFWASRLMCVKGVWNTGFVQASAILEDEFRFNKLSDIVTALFRSTTLPLGLELELNAPLLNEQGKGFSNFIWGNSNAAHYVRWHLSEQSSLFSTYVDTLVGESREVLLVDSGWQGTAQTLLADWRSDVEWWGGYFGRLGTPSSDRRYWNNMIGLELEADSFDPQHPTTAIVLHRHLIESLFEPIGPSVEHLIRNDDLIFAPASESILADDPNVDTAPIITAVMDYVRALPPQTGAGAITKSADRSWRNLARIITFPTECEARAMGTFDRSADFGRTLKVPTLLSPLDRHINDSSESRIAQSLWPSGQAAIEYGPKIAIAAQQSICGFKITPSFFIDENVFRPERRPQGSVAVITRTMDRPIFLKRAIQSVANQKFEHYLHVIICDGGNIDETKETIEQSQADMRKTVLIDNIINRGMETSSNIAITNSDSDYVVIHDDDDTWDPRFLNEMINFLDGRIGKKYGGAISHTWYVSEEVTSDGVQIRSKRPYHDWVQNVQIMEMAQENFFAPISFVFRRSAYEAVGGFDEDFPVLGDWDFNLRFLSVHNIGVIPMKLANYHHRDVGNKNLFANSVTGSVSQHAEFNAIMRNKFIRSQAAGGSLGVIVNLGMSLTDMRNTARRTLAAAEQLHHIKWPLSPSSDIDIQISRLQFDADQRWIALAKLVEDYKAHLDMVKTENALLKEREKNLRETIVGDTKVQQLLHEFQRLADERWVALCSIEAPIENASPDAALADPYQD